MHSSYNAQVDPSQEEEWYFCGEQWVFPLIPIILVNVMIFSSQAPLFLYRLPEQAGCPDRVNGILIISGSSCYGFIF